MNLSLLKLIFHEKFVKIQKQVGESMPECKVCSHDVSESDIYCINCGHKLVDDAPTILKEEIVRTPCSRKVTLFCAFVLGGFGAHNWYLGQKTTFFMKFGVSLISFGLFMPVMWVWSIVEGFVILRNKDYQDAYGVRLGK